MGLFHKVSLSIYIRLKLVQKIVELSKLKWSKLVQTCPKLLRLAQIGPDLSRIVPTCMKLSKLVQFGPDLSKIVLICLKLSKLVQYHMKAGAESSWAYSTM